MYVDYVIWPMSNNINILYDGKLMIQKQKLPLDIKKTLLFIKLVVVLKKGFECLNSILRGLEV